MTTAWHSNIPLFFLQSSSSCCCFCCCRGSSLIKSGMLRQWQEIKIWCHSANFCKNWVSRTQRRYRRISCTTGKPRDIQRSRPLYLVVNYEHLLEYVESGKSCSGRDKGRLKLNSKKLRAHHPPVLLSADVPPHKRMLCIIKYYQIGRSKLMWPKLPPLW